MITVDILKYITDRVWFGLHFRGMPNIPPGFFSKWEYISMWRFRLYPCMHIDGRLPDWWIDIFAKFSKDGL